MKIHEMDSQINKLVRERNSIILDNDKLIKNKPTKGRTGKYLIILFVFVFIMMFKPIFVLATIIMTIIVFKQAAKETKIKVAFEKSIKSHQKKIEELNAEIKSIEESKKHALNKLTFNSYVAGTSHRQKEIKSLVKYLANEYLLFVNTDYELTKRELIEYRLEDENIYQYEKHEFELKLIPEPENKHDDKAIAVYYDDEQFKVQLGYVPARHLDQVHAMDIRSVRGVLMGGKFRILIFESYDIFTEKATYSLKRGTHDYKIDLFILQKEW